MKCNFLSPSAFTTFFSDQLSLEPKEAPTQEKKDAILDILSKLISYQTSPAKNSKENIERKITLSFPMASLTEKIKQVQWINLRREGEEAPDLYVKVTASDSEKTYYSIKSQGEWKQTLGSSLLYRLLAFFEGNQIEMKARQKDQMFEKKASQFWKGGKWRDNRHSDMIYCDIECRIEQLLDKILNTSFGKEEIPRTEQGVLNLLEFFGGKGTCAEKMMAVYGTQMHYFLTELDEASVDLAKKNLGSTAAVFQFDAINSDLALFESYHPFGVVLASGGTTWEVLESKEEAITVLKRMFEMVAPGGILVLTGKQRQWVSDKELEKLLKGTMLNRYDVDLKREFYILQKKKED